MHLPILRVLHVYYLYYCFYLFHDSYYFITLDIESHDTFSSPGSDTSVGKHVYTRMTQDQA